MTEQFNFAKDFHNVTTLHPLGLMVLFATIFAVMLVPRRYVLVSLIAIACLIAPAQRVVVFGLDFTLLRVVTSAVWARMFFRDELKAFKFMLVDHLVIAWGVFSVFGYFMLYPNAASIGFQMGMIFDTVGTYFVVRFLVRDVGDITALARSLAILSVPVACAMMYERVAGHNAFSIFGGVPEQSLLRQGRFRAQAAFPHPIIAGTFWAALMPIILAGVRRNVQSVVLTAVGVVSSLAIVWASSSSTPVLLLGVLSVGCCLFAVRWTMPWIRWGAAMMLVILHVVMFAPVWHLFARINFFAGSTGWWRYLIIDRFINNWDEWFVIGTTRSTSWLLNGGFVDVTNQYVVEGVNGGIVKLGLFIGIIALSFAAVGRAVRERDARMSGPRAVGTGSGHAWIAWCMGVGVAMHAAAYFATAYFGQIIMLPYMAMGLAAAMPAVLGHRVVGFRVRAVDDDRNVIAEPAPTPDESAAAPGSSVPPAWPGFAGALPGGRRRPLFRPV